MITTVEPPKINVSIDRRVWKKARLAAVEKEITLKEFVEKALEEALAKK